MTNEIFRTKINEYWDEFDKVVLNYKELVADNHNMINKKAHEIVEYCKRIHNVIEDLTLLQGQTSRLLNNNPRLGSAERNHTLNLFNSIENYLNYSTTRYSSAQFLLSQKTTKMAKNRDFIVLSLSILISSMFAIFSPIVYDLIFPNNKQIKTYETIQLIKDNAIYQDSLNSLMLKYNNKIKHNELIDQVLD